MKNLATSTEEEVKEQICAIGSRIKVKWGKEELGNTGWHPGWYVADVQSYDAVSDVISVVYPSEPVYLQYRINSSTFFSKNKTCRSSNITLM